LRGAIRAIAEQGAGVVVYLPQEGRGIGLVNKLRAYALQDAGFDTIDANTHLGFEPDERSYVVAGEIMRRLGITRIRLLTNNPGKRAALDQLGVEVVDRVPLVIAANPHNEAYLRTKALRDGHSF
jgi:GTP cyclohydrolase II